MAISTSLSRATYCGGNAAYVHENMQKLRQHLLDVGLQEIIPDSNPYYDASESGTDSQVPTTINTDSNWMYFSLTDPGQTDLPIYLGFRVRFRYGYNSNATHHADRYFIQPMVTTGLDGDTPSVVGALTGRSNEVGNNNPNAGYFTLQTSTNSNFDVIRFSPGCLLIAFMVNHSRASGSNWSGYWAPYEAGCFLYLERIGDVCHVLLDTATHQSLNNVDSTYAQSNIIRANNIVTTLLAGIESPAGLIKTSNGVKVVAPVYSQNPAGDVVPLSKIFSVEKSGLVDGQILTLDFTGVSKRYMYLTLPSTRPYAEDRGWLFEWE